MASSRMVEIVIPRNLSGTAAPRAIFDHTAHAILQSLGTVSTKRASHVEIGQDLDQAALKVLASQTPAFVEVAADGQQYHIKPDFAQHWFADMTPTETSLVLGPYEPGDREKALADEVAWLRKNHLPAPQ